MLFFGGVLIFACSELRLRLNVPRLPRGNQEGGEHNHWPDVVAFRHLALELL